jgi:hypothetical protein
LASGVDHQARRLDTQTAIPLAVDAGAIVTEVAVSAVVPAASHRFGVT